MECSIITRKDNENIIGTAPCLDAQLAFELQEPWASVPNQSTHFPKNILPSFNGFYKNNIKLGVSCIKKSNSPQNLTRIFYFYKEAWNSFKKIELLVPNELLNEAINCLLQYQLTKVNNFTQWQVNDNSHFKEIIICTHAERDQCCGKEGLNLYKNFSQIISQKFSNKYRVWQSTHLGGHRYAPTFYESSSMRWYGLFQVSEIENFLNEKLFIIKNNYRGAAGLDHIYFQYAEKELYSTYKEKWLTAQNVVFELLDKYEFETGNVKVKFQLENETEEIQEKFSVTLASISSKPASCNSKELKTIKYYKIAII